MTVREIPGFAGVCIGELRKFEVVKLEYLRLYEELPEFPLGMQNIWF
jgi:hypothetical protein